MAKLVTIVGRANVGKSTLFNRISATREAIVFNMPGVTKDRKYINLDLNGNKFTLVDTAGWLKAELDLEASIQQQTEIAINEADLILFILDAKAGIMSSDLEILTNLRKQNKNYLILVNKIDAVNDNSITEFYSLGSDFLDISATHNKGISKLKSQIIEKLYSIKDNLKKNIDNFDKNINDKKRISISIVGRPNVGKSSLINRIIKQERLVVDANAGTTTDSIEIEASFQNKNYVLLDTAGIRRRKYISLALEKFSIIKTLDAVEKSDISVLLLDGTTNFVSQDVNLIRQLISKAKPLIIAVNKTENLTKEQENQIKYALDRKLHNKNFYLIQNISALSGKGINKLFQNINILVENSNKFYKTSKILDFIKNLEKAHSIPKVMHRQIKIKLVKQVGVSPPTFIFHGNDLITKINHDYVKYLINNFKDKLGFKSVPIRFIFKSGENPYHKKNIEKKVFVG